MVSAIVHNLQIVKLAKYKLLAKIMIGDYTGKVVFLPCIKLDKMILTQAELRTYNY